MAWCCMKKYDNYVSNLDVLKRADEQKLDNEFVISGIKDKFCLQFELSWKLLKELLTYEGRAEAATGSPREIIKAAYTVYDFMDETVWLDMLRDRNTSTHIYDGEEVRRLAQRVIDRYIPAFERMRHAIDARYADVLDEL